VTNLKLWARRHRNIGRQCGSAEDTQIDVRNAVLMRAQHRRDALSGFDLDAMALPIVERERVCFETISDGAGERHCGIQSATHKHHRALHGLNFACALAGVEKIA
jgi:hypothetical protein